jgi:hypothetical protein
MNNFLNSMMGSNNFSSIFSKWIYDKNQISGVTLDIWKPLVLKISQEEKYNTQIFTDYRVLSTDYNLETISNNLYKKASLWWTILLANQEDDPFDFLQNVRDNEEGKYINSEIKVFTSTGLTKLLNISYNLDNINNILKERQ